MKGKQTPPPPVPCRLPASKAIPFPAAEVGTYFGEEAYARNRASMTAMVRKAWRDYRAVPVFSWHVENPYAPSGWTDPKYGEKPYRYRYASEGYPQEDKCVIREILEGIGGKCGRGRQSSCGEEEVAAAAAYSNPRAWYEARLKEIASFLDGLKDADGAPIPAVVRLFHECEDDWAWWGLGPTTTTGSTKRSRRKASASRSPTCGAAMKFPGRPKARSASSAASGGPKSSSSVAASRRQIPRVNETRQAFLYNGNTSMTERNKSQWRGNCKEKSLGSRDRRAA